MRKCLKRMISRLLVIITLGSLVFSGIFLEPNVLAINKGAEYESGIIEGDPLDIWYTWINTRWIQLLYASYVSDIYPPPFLSIMAQHFLGDNNTEIFFAMNFIGIEFFDDENNNSYFDMDPTSGASELRYFIFPNASFSVVPINVTKSILEYNNKTIAVYRWGFSFNSVQGCLMDNNGQLVYSENDEIIDVIVEYLIFEYELRVHQDTYLCEIKQSIEIGNITFYEYIPGVGRYPLSNSSSFYNLGLSLIFAITLASNMNLTFMSTTENRTLRDPNLTPTPVQNITLNNGTHTFLEMGFNENYTIFPENQSYRANVVAYSKDTLPSATVLQFYTKNDVYDFIGSVFKDSVVFPSEVTPDLSYNRSTFIYRIMYPMWQGRKISHDPKILVYPSAKLLSEYVSIPPGVAPMSYLFYHSIIFLTIFVGVIFFLIAVIRAKNIKRNELSPLTENISN
ncbi:MAG: hypothetical protein ABGF52_10420 [Candidatus Asgardarchaeum sp.]